MAKQQRHKQDIYRDVNLPTIEEMFEDHGLGDWKLELVDGHGDIQFYRATKGSEKVSSPQIQNLMARMIAIDYGYTTEWNRAKQTWEAWF